MHFFRYGPLVSRTSDNLSENFRNKSIGGFSNYWQIKIEDNPFVLSFCPSIIFWQFHNICVFFIATIIINTIFGNGKTCLFYWYILILKYFLEMGQKIEFWKLFVYFSLIIFKHICAHPQRDNYYLVTIKYYNWVYSSHYTTIF